MKPPPCFPAVVTPEKATELDLGVELFFAVCKDICIPASAKASDFARHPDA